MPQADISSSKFSATASQRPEVKSILLLSVPIIISQLAQIGTGVVDVVMAGHISPVVLGSVATGAAVWTPTMIFLLGLLYCLTHGVGSLKGQKREEEITSLAARGVTAGLLGGVILGAGLYFGSGHLFTLIGLSEDMILDATSYTRIVAFGFPGLGLFCACRFLLEASGGAKVVTFTVIGSIGLKIFLNDLFVFGGLGIEPMGVNGFGLSTAVVFWMMAAVPVIVFIMVPRYNIIWRGPLSLADIAFARLIEFVRNGFPIALNFLSDYLVMAVVALFIASIGPVAISSHQITVNIVSVFLMITTGVGMAGTIIISSAAGSGNSGYVRRAAGLCLVVSLSLSLVITTLLALKGDTLAHLYTSNPDILAQASTLLDVAAMLFTVNVASITLGFVFRGVGQPGTPFLIMVISHWGVSIPLGYLLAETSFITDPLGVVGWWYGLMTSVILATFLLTLRLSAALTKG